MTKETKQTLGVEAIKTLLQFDNSYTLKSVNVGKDEFILEINLGSLKFTISGDVASMLQIGLSVPRTAEAEATTIDIVSETAGKVGSFFKNLGNKAVAKITTGTSIGKNYLKAATKVLTSKEVQEDLLKRMQKEMQSK